MYSFVLNLNCCDAGSAPRLHLPCPHPVGLHRRDCCVYQWVGTGLTGSPVVLHGLAVGALEVTRGTRLFPPPPGTTMQRFYLESFLWFGLLACEDRE